MNRMCLFFSLLNWSVATSALPLLNAGLLFDQKDSTVLSTFTVKKVGGTTNVEITYDVNLSQDDTGTDVLTYLRGHPGGTVLNANGMKNEILKIVLKDPHVDPMIDYPFHMTKIIDLIDGDDQKQLARDIYKEANIEKVVVHTSKSNFQMENGKRQDVATYTYSFTLAVKRGTTLTIPSLIFTHNATVLRTKELVIEIE